MIQKHFFIALFITKSKYYLCSVLLIISENSGKFLHSANFISNVGGSRKPKSNETSTFAQSRQSRWIFLDHAVFYVRSLPSEKYRRFHLLFELYYCNEQLWHCFTLNHYQHLLRFCYFKKLVVIACISKKLSYFSLFLSTAREIPESTTSEHLNFTGSNCRI